MDSQFKTAIYNNRNYPIEERVQDLLSKMTLEEKVRQMDMYQGSMFVNKMSSISRTAAGPDTKFVKEKAAAVSNGIGVGCIHDLYPIDSDLSNTIQEFVINDSRLGIPVLFSEEALHGLSSPGNTIFPQAICMASTWNEDLVFQTARAIASETRSKGIHLVFNPVLEIARDPRWGRTEETYGEDTCLASRLAYSMVRGLQGDSLSSHDSVVSEVKHFAVHSIPNGGLNCMSCSVGERMIRSDFLPVFKSAIVDGKAMSVMCAYHSIDGIPCAASKWLLTDVLRGEWGFQGFVCSDLGAIKRLHTIHHVADSFEDAIRQAVEAGVDMQFFDFDNDFFQNALISLVKSGALSEAAINRAVSSILRVKFMLGLFDNPYVDTSLSKKVTRSKKHLDTSLEVARQGICLLKNENGLLPLSKELTKIAVIGPNADRLPLGDYTPPVYGFKEVTLLEGIKSIVKDPESVIYEKGCSIREIDMDPVNGKYFMTPDGSMQGLKGEHFNDISMEKNPDVTRIDPAVDFNFIMQIPGDGINSDEFAVRWSGYLVPEISGTASVGFISQDSYRVFIEGKCVLDSWKPGSEKTLAEYEFEKNKKYPIVIEYKKHKGGGRAAKLCWSFDEDDINKAVEAAKNADVAIVALGESRDLCGESRDRSDLSLTGRQEELLMKIYETGTPVVAVLFNGRPLTVSRVQKHIPAIIEAWFPGDRGGIAIAEILFGLCNPSGKLPISFPKNVGQLPIYYNRPEAGKRRYVDSDSLPLYAFGDGLSYSTFVYNNLKLSKETMSPDEEVTVSVDITNASERDGYETVMLFITDVFSSVVTPDIALKDFKKVFIKGEETITVSFQVGFDHLKLLNRSMTETIEKGTFEIHVGGNLKNTLKKELNVI
jgi:beta-glucosidase